MVKIEHYQYIVNMNSFHLNKGQREWKNHGEEGGNKSDDKFIKKSGDKGKNRKMH